MPTKGTELQIITSPEPISKGESVTWQETRASLLAIPLIKLSPLFLLLMRSTASFCYSVTTENNLFSLCVSVTPSDKTTENEQCYNPPVTFSHLPLWEFTNNGQYPSLLYSSCHPPAASDLADGISVSDIYVIEGDSQ